MQDPVHGLPIIALDRRLVLGVERGDDGRGVLFRGVRPRDQQGDQCHRGEEFVVSLHWLLTAAYGESGGERRGVSSIRRIAGNWSIAARWPISKMRGMAAVSHSPTRR